MAKPDISEFVVEPDEDARAASDYLRARVALSSLLRLRHAPHRWLPLLRVTRPEMTTEAALTRLNSLIVEARALLAKAEKRAHRYLARQHATTITDFAIQSPVAFAIQAAQATPNCQPDSGLEKYPTAAKEYRWHAPTVSDDHLTRGGTLWTLVKRENWWEFEPSIDVGFWNPSEAEGIAFEVSVNHQNLTDILDVGLVVITGGASLVALGPLWGNSIASTFCLQYTIPAPQCDVVLHWETTAFGLLPSGVELDAEKGRAGIDITVSEQTPAAGFPSLPSSFRTVRTISTFSPSSSIRIEANIAGSFNVAAGQQSCIYLGIDCGCFVTEGEVCTGQCISSPAHPHWHNGLFFTWYSPRNVFSYPVPGIYWATTPR
jgi:hypothetical protein